MGFPNEDDRFKDGKPGGQLHGIPFAVGGFGL